MATGRFLVAAVALGACTNAYVEPLPTTDNAVDDHITLHTQVCTNPPNPEDFPVKVLFIVDESGSMCVSDPPGSQPMENSICEVYCSQIVPQSGTQALAPGCATNNTKPERVQALEQVLAQFQQENDAIEIAAGGSPGDRKGPIQVAIVPFETNVFTNVFPTTQYTYTTIDSANIGAADAYVDALQSELGNGTDYQGVLGYAFSQMSSDMENTKTTASQELPRSRYVIVWVTDGTPYPRCTSTRTPDGGLPEADYANSDPFNKPYLTWDDDPVDYCLEAVGQVDCGNAVPPPANCKAGMSGSPTGVSNYAFGTDRNQNYQIFDEVNQIMALKAQYNVGEINFNTVLIMNQLAVQLCGPQCIDLYGDFPNLNPNQESAAAYSVATWLLSNMSRIGNGVFQSFVNGQITQISLAGIDYASFAAQNVMKNLFVQALRTVPTPTGRVFDSDGDGLPDSLDNTYTMDAPPYSFMGMNPVSPYIADSDADCYDDKFEVTHKSEGFDPTTPDPRCCPNGVCPPCADTDGDGLSQCAEAYLGTDPGLVDSDADGIPDGIEARYGFNPNHYDAFATQDTDGDGISDLDEFLANTDPTVADAELYSTDAYHYDIVTTTKTDNEVCYDITVSNIRMLQVPSNTNADGYNLYKIWFDQAPASVLDSDYGIWKVSCAWTQYEPPGFRVPDGPILDMTTTNGTNNWYDTPQLISDSDYLTKCAGVAP